jgi:hypothetical protein
MKAPIPASPWYLAGAAIAACAALAGLVVLFLLDPATTRGLYPVCVFHEATGLQCPGCGTLRALHQLTHGNFAAAWGLNPFVVSLLPAGMWLAVREAIWLATGARPPGIITRPFFGWLLLAGMVAFGVLRNLPALRSHL